ncbi:MAG: hypothetical protein M3436_17520 [Pseudomonadota bacterium]|nr:hypothetical protein [Pseudomonadota bacterium]
MTVWRWTSIGLLPKPVKIGPNSTRWLLAEVEAAEAKWLHAREAEPPPPAPAVGERRAGDSHA